MKDKIKSEMWVIENDLLEKAESKFFRSDAEQV